jgi:hypothetical protein
MLLLTLQSPIHQCLNYEKHPVVLVGTIKLHTFPGKPNYESVARGDEPERVWLLQLDRPICVEADDSFQKEANVSRIQLVLSEGQAQYDQYRALLGQRVVVEGELFHAITGHHHTRVFI